MSIFITCFFLAIILNGKLNIEISVFKLIYLLFDLPQIIYFWFRAKFFSR